MAKADEGHFEKMLPDGLAAADSSQTTGTELILGNLSDEPQPDAISAGYAPESITTVFNPLDRVRMAESEAMRRLIAARQAGEQKVANARAQATREKNQAREDGARKGRSLYQQMIAESEDEARRIKDTSRVRKNTLENRGKQCMQQAVEEGIRLVLGTGQKGQENP